VSDAQGKRFTDASIHSQFKSCSDTWAKLKYPCLTAHHSKTVAGLEPDHTTEIKGGRAGRVQESP